MRIRRLAPVLVLVAAMPLAALAGQVDKSRAVTVKDFAVMLATANGSRAATPEAAVKALKDAGVPLGNVSARLSERKLGEILDFYGVKTATGSPDRGVTRDKAEAALLLANGAFTTAASAGPTPATIDDCAMLSNHGQCVNCCKGFNPSASACAKFCFSINKPSPSEPLP